MIALHDRQEQRGQKNYPPGLELCDDARPSLKEQPMIVELVTFNFPAGHDRDSELEAVRGVTAKWAANKDLVRKHFLWGVGDDAGTGAGVYIWPSIEAAERAHGDEWREGVKKRTGGYPTMRYFDLMTLVDNENGTVTEWDANGKARQLETV
jgi:hypothetical protein